MKRTKCDEDDHPDADVDLTTTMPVLENRTSGINVVGGDDQILHEIIVPKGKTDGGVHETGGITCEATLVWNVGGHFTERNHDEIADETDEAISQQETEGATSGEVRFEWV